jgi:hypothetical protein
MKPESSDTGLWQRCGRGLRRVLRLPRTQEEAQRERRLFGIHPDELSGLPTTDDPECDVENEATIRR